MIREIIEAIRVVTPIVRDAVRNASDARDARNSLIQAAERGDLDDALDRAIRIKARVRRVYR